MRANLLAQFVVGMLVATNVSAGTVLHQVQTTSSTKSKEPKEQYSIVYLDGNKFRHELFDDKAGKGEWRTLAFFDGKQAYSCKRDKDGKPQGCQTTGPGGPLEMLDSVVKSTGGTLQAKIKSFAFTSAGPAQTVAAEKCEPRKMTMQLELGMILGGNFVPAANGDMTGTHCISKIADWNPASMIDQLKPFGGYFTNKADFNKFLGAIKSGVGFDLVTDTKLSVELGGKGSRMETVFKRTTTKVEQSKIAASQFELPKGFELKK